MLKDMRQGGKPMQSWGIQHVQSPTTKLSLAYLQATERVGYLSCELVFLPTTCLREFFSFFFTMIIWEIGYCIAAERRVVTPRAGTGLTWLLLGFPLPSFSPPPLLYSFRYRHVPSCLGWSLKHICQYHFQSFRRKNQSGSMIWAKVCL